MSVDIVDIFCDIDDSCKGFEKKWKKLTHLIVSTQDTEMYLTHSK